MHMLTALATAAAMTLAAPVAAGFTNLVVESTSFGSVHVHRIYAQFNSENDVVLSFAEIAVINGPFFHSDSPGGTFAPQFTLDPAKDSFVTIGGTPGVGNSTGMNGFPSGSLAGASIPAGSSWFNLTPDNSQGKVDPITHRTLIAQLAFTSPTPYWQQMSGLIKWNQGAGTPTQQAFALFTPAPGALLPLLAGVVVARRRSRR